MKLTLNDHMMGADAPIPPIAISAAAPAGALAAASVAFPFLEPGNLPRRAVPRP